MAPHNANVGCSTCAHDRSASKRLVLGICSPRHADNNRIANALGHFWGDLDQPLGRFEGNRGCFFDQVFDHSWTGSANLDVAPGRIINLRNAAHAPNEDASHQGRPGRCCRGSRVHATPTRRPSGARWRRYSDAQAAPDRPPDRTTIRCYDGPPAQPIPSNARAARPGSGARVAGIRAAPKRRPRGATENPPDFLSPASSEMGLSHLRARGRPWNMKRLATETGPLRRVRADPKGASGRGAFCGGAGPLISARRPSDPPSNTSGPSSPNSDLLCNAPPRPARWTSSRAEDGAGPGFPQPSPGRRGPAIGDHLCALTRLSLWRPHSLRTGGRAQSCDNGLAQSGRALTNPLLTIRSIRGQS